MLLYCYACSKKGNFRENNEDNLYIDGMYADINHSDVNYQCKCNSDDIVLTGVFDGLGGEEKGEEASYLAASLLNNFSKKGELVKYFNAANEKILNIERSSGTKQVGSTAAILKFYKDEFTAANIGDSRIYAIRNNRISLLSVDHTMVETMISSGVITREDAKKSAYKNVLTQCLGMDESEIIISPYISEKYEMEENDVFVICSDGLTGSLSEDDIVNIINENKECENIAEILVDMAYENGTRDNTTVIVIIVKNSGIKVVLDKLIDKLKL